MRRRKLKMASRSLKDLSRDMQGMAELFLANCVSDRYLHENGVTVLVICTYRSNVEQNKLYAQGRTAPGHIVTRARGGQSKHNARDTMGNPAAEAVDVLPLLHGKPMWADRDDKSTPENELEIWQQVGALGKQAGLKWYGEPDAKFREFPHFQNPNV